MVAALVACSSPLEPERIVGTYGWSGAELGQAPNDAPIIHVADTIRFLADGTAFRRSFSRSDVPGAAVTMTETEYRFIIEGRSLGLAPAECGSACPRNLPRYWLDRWGTLLVPRAGPRLAFALVGTQPD